MIPLKHQLAQRSLSLLICLVSLSAFAQQPRSPRMPAPPPMRFVAPEDRSQLSATRDPKNRIRTTIELAASHLTHTEEFTNQSKFDEASEELGIYLGLIDDVRDFIAGQNHDKGSTRDLYRHLEIALRAQLPRLAVIRRSTPADYSGNLKAAEDYVRDTRSMALDSFYGHSVLRDDPSEKKPSSSREPEKNERQ
jgi:hypothetical protein